MGELAEIRIGFVDQTVREQEYLHPQFTGNHIVAYVVAHHQAFFGRYVQLLQNFAVVIQIGLAVTAVFIGGVQFKILFVQPRPAHAAFGGDGGEEGIGGQRKAVSLLPERGNALRCLGIEAAVIGYLLEFVVVEIIKDRKIIHNMLAADFGKITPEGLLIRAGAVVLNHRAGGFPDGFDRQIGVVAVRRQLAHQTGKIGFEKYILILRQKRAVQIKQNSSHRQKKVNSFDEMGRRETKTASGAKNAGGKA